MSAFNEIPTPEPSAAEVEEFVLDHIAQMLRISQAAGLTALASDLEAALQAQRSRSG